MYDRNCDTGWVLCHISMVFDSFQTMKRHSYNGYSILIAIFNSFHEVVYPAGVTTNLSCFTRIIGHNSRTIHQICTKFDARIRLWTPFLYAKLQGDRSTRLHFIAHFPSVQKHEEKNEEKIETLAARISEMAGAIPLKLVCRLPWLAGNSVENLVPIG